jgi:hypothetical protein
MMLMKRRIEEVPRLKPWAIFGCPSGTGVRARRILAPIVLAATALTSLGAPPPPPPIRGTPIDLPPPANVATAGTATNTPAKPPTGSRTAKLETKNGYLQTGFDVLSDFPCEVVYERVTTNSVTYAHAQKMNGEIPDDLRALNDKKVAVRGFMLPLKEEDGLTTDFILLRSRMMCCYGTQPNINEWVHVKMAPKGVTCLMDTPVTICGTLHVAEYRENRTMLGIYRLDGEKMEEKTDSAK